MATNANQSINNTQELITFLKRAPATQIQDFVNNNLMALPELPVFSPVVER